jgi:hypothetical protein
LRLREAIIMAIITKADIEKKGWNVIKPRHEARNERRYSMVKIFIQNQKYFF